MGSNDFWSVVSIAAFLGIGVAGYYVIDKFGKGSSSGFPDIQGIIDGILGSIGGGGGSTTTPPASDGDTTTTPPATTPPGTTPPSTTPPGGGTSAGTTKVVAAGDWGSGRNSNWQQVTTAMAKEAPDVVVVPGDLAYSGGPAKFKPVTDAMRKFAKKIFGSMGNHDAGGDSTNFDGFSNSVQNYGNCSFMLLDTESGSSSIAFAKANFVKMTGKWKFVIFHKPIKTMKSDHPADEGKIGALIPEFEKAKINVVIQAHNHNYQRFAPVNGVTYFVCGTGGESHYSLSGGGAVKSDASNFGYTLFVATSSSLTGKFVSTSGTAIDTFTITGSAALAKAYSSNEMLRPLYTQRISIS